MEEKEEAARLENERLQKAKEDEGNSKVKEEIKLAQTKIRLSEKLVSEGQMELTQLLKLANPPKDKVQEVNEKMSIGLKRKAECEAELSTLQKKLKSK